VYFGSQAPEKDLKATVLYENCLQMMVTLLPLSEVGSEACIRIVLLVEARSLVALSLALQ
jgi:hypothetical protein